MKPNKENYSRAIRKTCFLLLLAALAGCSGGPGVDLIPAANRNAASEIDAKFINRSALYLSQMKGKVVVLNFWATWCGPCRMEIPTLVKLQNAFRAKGLEVVGLSVEFRNTPPREFFDKFISDNGMNYPVGVASYDTVRSYGVNPIPTSFFIDKSGRIAFRLEGAAPEEYFAAAIKKLLAE